MLHLLSLLARDLAQQETVLTVYVNNMYIHELVHENVHTFPLCYHVYNIKTLNYSIHACGLNSTCMKKLLCKQNDHLVYHLCFYNVRYIHGY